MIQIEDSIDATTDALARAGIYHWIFSETSGTFTMAPTIKTGLGIPSWEWRRVLRSVGSADRRVLWRGFLALRETGISLDVELGFAGSTTGVRNLRITGSRSPSGQIGGVVADVSAKELAKRNEAESEAHSDLWFHLERSTLGLVEWDENFRVIRWSRRAEEIFGWSEAEVLGLRIDEFKFVYEEDWDDVNAVVTTFLDGSSDSANCYNRNYEKSGHVKYCIWHTSVRRDADGKIISLLSLANEVSSQIAVALSNHDASEQLRATLENLSDAFIAIDKRETIIYANKLMLSMLGLSPDQAIGRNISEIFTEEDNLLGFMQCRRAMREQVMVEYEQFYVPTNSWIAARACPTPDQLTIFIRDVTEERDRRQQLRLLESAVATTNDMVVITEAEPISQPGPRVVFVNDAFLRRTGYERDEVIGQTPRMLQGPETDRQELDRIRTALQKWEPIRADVVNYTKSGEPFWLEMSIVPIANEDGWYTHWVAIERDVTDRKRAEEELRLAGKMLAESAAQYQNLFENGPQPMCVYDLETLRIVAINQAAIRHYGYAKADFLNLTIVDVTAPDTRERLKELVSAAHLPGRRVHKLRNITRSGELIEVDVYTDLIDFGGRPARMVLVNDVTERIRAERELARMTRAKELISRCNEATAQLESEEQLLQEICRLAHEIGGYNLAWIGFALDEPGKPIVPAVAAGTCLEYLKTLEISWDENSPLGGGPAGRAIRTQTPMVAHDSATDASVEPWRKNAIEFGLRSVVSLPLSDRSALPERAFGLLTLYSDGTTKITSDEVDLLAELAKDLAYGIQNLRSRNEQKRLEGALLEVAASVSAASGAEFFRNLVDSMTRVTGAAAGFAAEFAPSGTDRIRTLAGLEGGEQLPVAEFELGNTFVSLLTQEQTVSISSVGPESAYHDPIINFIPQGFVGCRLTGADRVPLGFLYLYFTEPITSPDFAVSALRIFAARAAAEIERKDSLRKIQEQASSLDRANESITVQNIEGVVTYWNAGSEILYGWTRDEAVGAEYRQLVGGDEAIAESMHFVLSSGDWKGEFHRTSKSGSPLIISSRWTLVRDGDGKPSAVLIIESDISDRRRLEERLLRSQRLDGIGTLAGGIAHDLNNVLTPIILSTDMLLMSATSPRQERSLQAISKNARRAADMIHQILNVARGMVVNESFLPCVNFLETLRHDVEPMLGPEDVLEIECPLETWNIVGDDNLLRQVFVNLCINARDASKDSGGPFRRVVLRAGNLTVERTQIEQTHGLLPGPYVQIDVIDHGTGMSSATRAQIFDPFFTTKPVGSGTGLGLSISLAIIKSHGGTIEVDSQLGQGSRFRVYLPARP